MDSAQRHWLLINAIGVTAAVNLVLNALPAWFSARDLDHVPLWTVPLSGGTGVFTDTLGTFLVLPFVTTLVCTTAVWVERRKGEMKELERFPHRLAGLEAFPAGRALRGIAFAVVTICVLAGPFALGLALLAPDGLSHDAFIAYKTVLGICLGLALTPLIALRAMWDPLPTR